MLDTYIIDGQRFDRVGTTDRQTLSGKMMRVVVWRTACPDCGTTFEQGHRYAGFQPARNTTRRCRACRTYSGRRVVRSDRIASQFPTALPPPHPKHPDDTGDVTRHVSIEPRLVLPVEPPTFYPRPLHPAPRKPVAGVFTDR